MGIYIIGGVPMHIGGSHLNDHINNRDDKERKLRRRTITMAWILRKKQIHIQTPERMRAIRELQSIEDEKYEVGYMEEDKVFIEGMGDTLKFEFCAVYSFDTIQEAEDKVHYLNGGS